LKDKKAKERLPPSLRLAEDEDTGFLDLGVTPGFQKFVSERLAKFIDR